jgi:hypothetical protein
MVHATSAPGVLGGRMCLLAGGRLQRYGHASRAEPRLAVGDVVRPAPLVPPPWGTQTLFPRACAQTRIF